MNLRLIATIVLGFAGTVGLAQTTAHNFSVKDDIAMTRFSDPSDQQENFDMNHVNYSPDGRYVAIVTTRGLLRSDQVESTLSVFSMDTIEQFLRHRGPEMPQRRIVAVVTERPQGENENAEAPLIAEVRWAADSTRLYFKTENSKGGMQLEEVSADGKHLRRLTPRDYSVDRYDVENSTIVYTAYKIGQTAPQQGSLLNRDAFDVTGDSLRNILFSKQIYPQKFVLGILHPGDSNDTVHQVKGYTDVDIPVLLFLYPFRLSPDGRFLAATLPVSKIPDFWKQYDPEVGYEHSRFDPNDPSLTKPNNALRPREYVLINLQSGRTVPLIAGPNGRSLSYDMDQSVAAWVSDGHRVLVSNVLLPRQPASSELEARPCRVASVDLPTMRVRCLFFWRKQSPPSVAHIDAASFGPDGNEIVVSMKSNLSHIFVRKYVLYGDVWNLEQAANGDTSDPGLDPQQAGYKTDNVRTAVYVHQNLNTRATLWASDAGTGEARQIWDPNPQLSNVRFGEVSEYHWNDATGRSWVGGLVKPAGYLLGKRYPLILQLYMFRTNEFLTDGTEPTAFAAREFASNGFVVLQIQKKPSLFTEDDPQIHLQAYRSAVQTLTDEGLVDPSRVGVVGYSMTCWYAENAIVKAPHLFAAATIADGFDYNYMTYMLFGPGPPLLVEQANRVRGGGPFGPSQQEWFRDSLGFHLDQVQAPVRIEAHTPTSILSEWELYASLNLQHKPVDLIYLPQASHVLQRPWERYESQQGNIDWMSFWLQGYEDPDPSKRAQYQRWEAMKVARPPDHTGGTEQR